MFFFFFNLPPLSLSYRIFFQPLFSFFPFDSNFAIFNSLPFCPGFTFLSSPFSFFELSLLCFSFSLNFPFSLLSFTSISISPNFSNLSSFPLFSHQSQLWKPRYDLSCFSFLVCLFSPISSFSISFPLFIYFFMSFTIHEYDHVNTFITNPFNNTDLYSKTMKSIQFSI